RSRFTMGVHGLTSYMEGNRENFTDMKLRNTRLVIDGCSLYFRLYFTSGLDQIRGGDYDTFAKVVQRFFSALSSCSVSPFVVLDGGMDETDKKLRTLCERAQSKIQDAHSLSQGSNGSVLPLLTRDVFRQVLDELGVPLVQCVSEADFEIASLAHQWQCPVLSNDSDFYIFDLSGGYLPMTSFQWENVCGKAGEHYIPARRYTVSRFCSFFNNFNKQLLPLFAVIIGNDYTDPKITETFFSRVELPIVPRLRGSVSSTRIYGFFFWLLASDSLEEALEDVLQILGGRQTGKFRNQIIAGMQDYQLPPTSVLAQFFSSGHHGMKFPLALMTQPRWLLKQITSGALPPLVLDVLVLRRVFLMAQVENSCLPCSHEASLNIRKTIYGLLLLKNVAQGNAGCGQRGRGRGRGGVRRGGLTEQAQGLCAPCFVEEYGRFQLNFRRTLVEVQLPVHHLPLNLDTLDQVPIPLRRSVLLGTLGVMEHVLQPVDPHLHLPVCVTHFWMRSSTRKPSRPLLQSVLLGLVYGDLCRRMAVFGDPLHACTTTAMVCQRLDQLRVSPAQRRGVNLGVAHSLSQWQSCMWIGVYLNQLLCFPLPEPQCA
ncbi:protein asteroid 1, partial [Clarias magur]